MNNMRRVRYYRHSTSKVDDNGTPMEKKYVGEATFHEWTRWFQYPAAIIELDNGSALFVTADMIEFIEPTSAPIPVTSMQPIGYDNNVIRFRKNAIVRHLLDNGNITLNDIHFAEFDQGDIDQFYQLIGYSVSGYNELSLVSDESCERANFLRDCILKR